ncbi:MAG: hypothetical protein H7Y00_14610 [Fimbriimonadaceae bacterium]|nr:hypothetical protein [Chitinophagales bacterium]
MKFILTVVIGFVLCVAAQTFIPLWWIFAPLVFIIALVVKFNSGWRSFFAGFLIVFIAWLLMYLFKDAANNSILSTKMATVFSLPNNYLLFFIASLFMGIMGGLSAVAGYALRRK